MIAVTDGRSGGVFLAVLREEDVVANLETAVSRPV